MRSFLILLVLTAPAVTTAQPLSVTASVAVTWLDRVDAEPGTPTFGEPVSLGSVFPPAVVVLWRGRPGWRSRTSPKGCRSPDGTAQERTSARRE